MESDPKPSIIVQPTQGVVQLAGNTLHDMTTALGAQPILLLIILLNVAMCGSAAWFLLTQEHFRHEERLELIKVFSGCMTQPARP